MADKQNSAGQDDWDWKQKCNVEWPCTSDIISYKKTLAECSSKTPDGVWEECYKNVWTKDVADLSSIQELKQFGVPIHVKFQGQVVAWKFLKKNDAKKLFRSGNLKNGLVSFDVPVVGKEDNKAGLFLSNAKWLSKEEIRFIPQTKGEEMYVGAGKKMLWSSYSRFDKDLVGYVHLHSMDGTFRNFTLISTDKWSNEAFTTAFKFAQDRDNVDANGVPLIREDLESNHELVVRLKRKESELQHSMMTPFDKLRLNLHVKHNGKNGQVGELVLSKVVCGMLH